MACVRRWHAEETRSAQSKTTRSGSRWNVFLFNEEFRTYYCRLEAMATRVEAMATRVEAMATRVEAMGY